MSVSFLFPALSNDPPQERRSLARDLLATPDEQLEVTAVKVKIMFRECLELTARDGTVWPMLYTVFRPVGIGTCLSLSHAYVSV